MLRETSYLKNKSDFAMRRTQFLFHSYFHRLLFSRNRNTSLAFISTQFFIFIFSVSMSVAQTEKLTPEKLWKIPRVNLETTSADGQTVIYSVTTYDLETNKGKTHLYSVNVAGGAPRQLTTGDGHHTGARFRPDGKKIGFLNEDKLFEINPDGTSAFQVSDIPMNGFSYSPDGKQILFTADVKYFDTPQDIYPDLPLAKVKIADGLMYRHWKSWDNQKRSNIFISEYMNSRLVGEPFNIMANQPYDAPLSPSGGMEQICWSPDSRSIAYTCRKVNGTALSQSTNSDIYLFDVINRTTRNVTEGNLGYDQEPSFSPNSQFLVWNSMERGGFEADRNRIMLQNLQNGQRVELTEKYDLNANSPKFSLDAKVVYFINDSSGTRQLCGVDLQSRKIRQITSGLFDFTGFEVINRRLIAMRHSMSEPVEIYAIGVQNGETQKLTFETQAIWADVKRGDVRSRMVGTTDNKKMLVWTIMPPDFDPARKYPLVLLCQGGPQSMVSQSFSYRWNVQCLASQGYIVVYPSRRGMPGFGQAWNDSISHDWGGQAMRDLISAVDDVSREPFVDTTRRAAVGASFGGYSVFWLAGNHQKRFKTFVSHAGIFNMESFYGMTDEVWFSDWDMGAYWKPEFKKQYEQFSPHKFVQNWDTPILITQGGRDFRVPEAESFQAFQAAQLRNIPSKMLLIPDEGHHISTPHNSVLWYRAFYGWLNNYLKP
jgi:dipeptidyl aminopeptidase/acylaminoacyl peptidase